MEIFPINSVTATPMTVNVTVSKLGLQSAPTLTYYCLLLSSTTLLLSVSKQAKIQTAPL